MQEMSIIAQPKDWLPLTVPGAEGVSIKIIKADEVNNRVVLLAKFAPGSRMPHHVHHCTAIAYTLAGSWDYDEGHFETGDVAYESIGNAHVPWSDEGTEMVIVFDSPTGQYLDNVLPDGTVVHMGMPLFKALECIDLAAYEQLNIFALIDVLPGLREVA